MNFCILLGLLIVSVNANFDEVFEVITDYAALKNLQLLTIFHCWKSTDLLKLNKRLHVNYIRNSNIHINQLLINTDEYNHTTSAVFYEVYGYILDLSCNDSQAFLETKLDYSKWHSRYSSRYKWLLLNQNTECNISCVRQALRNVAIRYDSDITLMDTSKFYDLYNTGFNDTGGELVIGEKYQYKNGKFKATSNESVYESRKNLLGHSIRTITVVTKNISIPPEEYLIIRGLEDAVNKFHFALYLHLQEVHNFRITLFTTNAWFGSSPMGIEGGINKYLWHEKADFAATSGIMTTGRVLAVDFLISTTYKFGRVPETSCKFAHFLLTQLDRIYKVIRRDTENFIIRLKDIDKLVDCTCFIFRNPTASGKIRNQFFDPFATNIWYICIFFCVLFCIGERSSWSSSILNTLAAFCQQDIEIDEQNITGRILILSLMVLSLLLYNYYTSSIVSDLINSHTPIFTTLGELVHSSLGLGMEEIAYVYRLFNGSTDPDVQYLRSKIMEPGTQNKFYSAEDGIAQMRKGQFAYHVEPATGYSIIARSFDGAEICDLCEIYVFQLCNIYVISQKNSPYRKMFTIRKMSEHGLMNRQRLIWQAQKPECLSSANILQIELEQVAPAFIVLLIGLLLSVILLLFEIKPRILEQAYSFCFTKRHI